MIYNYSGIVLFVENTPKMANTFGFRREGMVLIMTISKHQNLHRTIIYMLMDAMCLAFSVFFALFLRFDFLYQSIEPFWYKNALIYLPIEIAVTLSVFYLFRFYHILWQFASVKEYFLIFVASSASAVVNTLLRVATGLRLPLSCYVLDWMLFAALAVGTRILIRVIIQSNNRKGKCDGKRSNVMIIGAGDAANTLMREIRTGKLHDSKRAVCVIDDDKSKKNRSIGGVEIVGGREKIPEAVRQYEVDEIIFAIPSAPPAERAEILNICKTLKCTLKTVPGLSQIVNNEAEVTKLSDVDVEDLLGRAPIKTYTEKIIGYIKGKVVLVTGGGGSIGSELCRQIAAHSPKKLIIFDVYENNAYDIQHELMAKHPKLDLEVLIGSAQDDKRISSVFETYHPQIVFHAAAHKHVPLMEDSPNEAVKNNVFGTLNTCKCADKYGAERFILISTDKAVNPTNVMGASKRICEMIVQTYAGRSKTKFAAVRFGNVLGSNGSVIPLFKKQIAAGGPVTVTHPGIIRFFMTIPEAVGLVLHAVAMANGGELFILDMGHPVKILDLAENLIRLSGRTPYEDIKIVFTGLRPGEKLYEEILSESEGLNATEDEMIYVVRPDNFDKETFTAQLEHLKEIMYNDDCDMHTEISKIVPIAPPQNE